MEELDLKSKRVVIRVDFNLTFSNEGKSVDSSDDFRIDSTMPLINLLIGKSAKIILVCHLGRPEGKVNEELSLEPIAKYFSAIIGRKVDVIKSEESNITKRLLGIEEKDADNFKNILSKVFLFKLINQNNNEFLNGDIIMLENLRFDSREEENSMELAEFLSRLCDIYINEAFSASHRNHASIKAIKRVAKHFYYGPLFNKEAENLKRFISCPVKPLVIVLGGAKVETKISLIRKFIGLADHILIGGVIANTILRFKGIAVGDSAIDASAMSQAEDLISSIDLTNTKIHLPVDVKCGYSLNLHTKKDLYECPIGKIKQGCVIGDLGVDTISLFSNIIKQANTIIWNGTLGYAENPIYEISSYEIAKTIISNKKCKSLIGGGDTISFLEKKCLLDKFSFISTGGGAMLEFLIEPRKFN